MTGFVDTVVFLALLGGLALLAWSPREVGATATFHPVSDRDATDAALFAGLSAIRGLELTAGDGDFEVATRDTTFVRLALIVLGVASSPYGLLAVGLGLLLPRTTRMRLVLVERPAGPVLRVTGRLRTSHWRQVCRVIATTAEVETARFDGPSARRPAQRRSSAT